MKFGVALLVAAALPFIVGLAVFERKGHHFLLFNDGIIEAANPAGDYFGVSRLAAKIVCDVTAFQRRRNYDDNACLVAVEAISSSADS